MKIVCVMGDASPEGSSVALARKFLETARSHDAEIEIVPLGKLEYARCKGCEYCKALGKCVAPDDLQVVLDSICGADILVLASPVLFGDMTSQMRDFISRTYSFLEPDFVTNPKPSRLPPGKKIVFVLTQEQPDEQLFADLPGRYDQFFKWCGFVDRRVIRACGLENAEQLAGREDVIKLAEETARELVA
jgi:multimeric flavodoxin WrbA